jgi:hypothetical protein
MGNPDQIKGVDVFIERTISSSPGGQDMCDRLGSVCACFELHRIEWRQTHSSTDGQRAIYHFRAPDAEAVRMTLRRAGIEYDVFRVEPVTLGPG